MTLSSTADDPPASSRSSSSNSNSTVSNVFRPAPRSEWKALVQGAEARVWKLSGNDNTEQWVCKERFSKAYRHPDLDERLTKSRCRSEAKNLEKCDTNKSNIRIRVPKVIRVEPPLLYLEYLNGPTVKDYWKQQLQQITTTTTTTLSQSNSSSETTGSSSSSSNVESSHQPPMVRIGLDSIAKSMGKVVGDLHTLGLVHGDLTTANMMLLFTSNETTAAMDSSATEQEEQQPPKYELALIDFGLAKSTYSTEEQAVDLYVLERALQSTHPELEDSFFATLLEAYSTTTTTSTSGSNSKKAQQSTLQRLEQVRLRGRKRECFG